MFKAKKPLFSTPVLLAFLAILSYALLTPGMGFYWDDWPFALTSRALGPLEFIPAMASARPFAGPLYALTALILRESPLAWQLFGVLARWLSAVCLWWALLQVWPSHRRQVAWVSVFFLVFPGFSQQWIALTYANQALVPMCFFTLSLGVMARTARSRRHFGRLTALALLLQIGGLFPTEYFYGLELLRPLLLWFVLTPEIPDTRRRLPATLRLWLPYLVVFILNTAWLFFYQRSSAYNGYPLQLTTLLSSGVPGFLSAILHEAARTLALAGFASWAQTLSLFTRPLDSLIAALSIAIVMLCLPGIYFYLRKKEMLAQAVNRETPTDIWARQAIFLGLLGILAGRLPSWAAGLTLRLEFHWDRFLLSMMIGASLFFVGMLEYFFRPDARKTALFSLFIALAVGWHFNTANTYRRDWENQARFLWQLTWRIPALERGTLLVTHELPFWYETDYSLSAAVNWTYAPDLRDHTLPHMLAYTKARFRTDLLPGYELDQPIRFNYRTFTFNGSTSQVVVFHYATPGCLLLLDPLYNDNHVVPGAPYTLTNAIPLSDPDRWVSDSPSPARPPQDLFGAEPARDWCYYFEKADLARQLGDWDAIPVLEAQAAQGGFSPRIHMEWLPFIEGAAHTGDPAHAAELTLSAYQADPNTGPSLCAAWKRIEQQLPHAEVQESTASITSTLDCPHSP